ncbi:MAG TPA: VanZ family protein [Terriglobia bacterium]|nr:VanZ family protein [Terriglobia bacterium]
MCTTSSSRRRPPTIASSNASPGAGNETRFQAFLWWIPVIVWAGVIFYMSTRTFGSSFTNHLLRDILAFLHLEVSRHTFPLLAFGFRKLGHLTEYSIFAIFLYHALGDEHSSFWNPRKALACILLAGLYSLTDEFHQRFVPGRGPSIVDSGIDTIGATLGMLIVYFAGRGRAGTQANVQPAAAGEDKLSPS